MILTEEQRAAIKLAMKYIARWPFAYKELHARGVLQAMIDSSEHIREPPKMVGFDLERARGLRDFLQDDCAEVEDVWAEMIAEIERLRGEMENYGDDYVCQMKSKDARIDELEADNQNLVTLNKSLMNNDWILRDNNRKYRKRAQKAELLNKKLKADLEQSERVIEARLEVIDQQAAKIRELEDAHKRSGVKYAKIINELRSSVYANIPGLKKQWDEILNAPANGKIGPDARPKCDHEWQAAIEERGYQTCLKCGECRDIKDIPRTAPTWQITEERKAAIQWAEEMAGDCKAGDVLRDMLAEVTR